MKPVTFLCILVTLCCLYAASTFMAGCAQIGAPVGGPKDTLPPVLVKIDPPNFSVNFTKKRIDFAFDEYVQLNNLQQNLLVNPTAKINPNVDYRLKTVTIKLKDTLQPNTTYSIQLGNSIQDINENNPYKDFTYTFSTGSYIDSLTLTGNVIPAETGVVDTTLMAMLYSDLTDSAVYKEKPKYVARVDSSGNFKFKYLPPGTYHLFALKDESGQMRYSDSLQMFAFADSTVSSSISPASVQLYAFSDGQEEPKPPASGKADEPLAFSSSLSGKKQDLLSPMVLSFNHPVEAIDSNSIKLTDTLFNKFKVRLELDTFQHKVSVYYPWAGSNDYLLIVSKDFALDTLGKPMDKNDTLHFAAMNESDYGSIKLEFKNLDKYQHPVLQFVSNKKIAGSFPLTSAVFEKKLFPPGEYSLRILEDSNGNGVWDPGNYMEKRQPEIVHLLKQKITLRANWGNEFDYTL